MHVVIIFVYAIYGHTHVAIFLFQPITSPNALFFFPPRLFDRRLSSSNDCFTGQSPGIGHDGSHLYTGGPRMCISLSRSP